MVAQPSGHQQLFTVFGVVRQPARLLKGDLGVELFAVIEAGESRSEHPGQRRSGLGLLDRNCGHYGKSGNRFEVFRRERGSVLFVDQLENPDDLVVVNQGDAENSIRAVGHLRANGLCPSGVVLRIFDGQRLACRDDITSDTLADGQS